MKPGKEAKAKGLTFSPNWRMINLQQQAREGKLGDWTQVFTDPAKCIKGKIS